MATRKMATSRTAKQPQSSADRQTKETLLDLRDFYQLGQQVLAADRKNPRNKTYSLGVVDEFAKKINKSRDYVHEARNFAERYTKADFDELCALRRPDRTPLTPRLVMALLRIKNKRERKKLQRQAAREGWSTRRTSAEVSKMLGKGGAGGRRPQIPQAVDDALLQVMKTDRWSRWHEGFDPQQDVEEVEVEQGIGLEDLPEPIQKQLKSAAKQLSKLKTLVSEELEPTRPQTRQPRS